MTERPQARQFMRTPQNESGASWCVRTPSVSGLMSVVRPAAAAA